MVKLKITGTRIAEVCTIAEYLLLSSGNKAVVIRVAPRFVLNDEGEYIVKPIYTDDLDIDSFENHQEAFSKLLTISVKRMDKLAIEFQEAIKQIVNPQSAGA